MHQRKWTRRAIVVISVIAAGCGGGGGSDPAPSATAVAGVVEVAPSPTPAPSPVAQAPAPAPAPAPGQSIKGASIVRALTLQIPAIRGPETVSSPTRYVMAFSQSIRGGTYGFFTAQYASGSPFFGLPTAGFSLIASPFNSSLYLAGTITANTSSSTGGQQTVTVLSGADLNVEGDRDYALDAQVHRWVEGPWFAELLLQSTADPDVGRVCWQLRLPAVLRLECLRMRRSDGAVLGAYIVDDSPGAGGVRVFE